MTPPLNRIRVIDQTQALAGPYCAMMLGDMGADVIKIERPGVGDNSRIWGPPFLGTESTYYLSVNRNKRGMTLNVTSEPGREILYKLIDGADIFLTNIATRDSLQKYGLDYETLKARNPRLIYVSISGYGRSGPRADQYGYDLVAQGESGLMWVTGQPDQGPLRLPTPMADMTCGMFATVAILAALNARHETGRGQMIDMALQDSHMTWLQNLAAAYFATGQEPLQMGNRHPQLAPYEPVQAADGKWFILGVGSENIWRKFCGVTGLEHLIDDPRFNSNANRVAHYAELMPVIRDLIARRSADEWLAIFREANIPVGRINSVSEALADPQLIERLFIVELEHPALGPVRSLATPILMSDTPLRYDQHPPMLGEHTHEILAELGYDQATIQRFQQEGVI
jgi:formyl-CoA transferase